MERGKGGEMERVGGKAERGCRELRGEGGGRAAGRRGVSCCRTFFPHVPNHSRRVILENSSQNAIANYGVSRVLSVNP